MNNPKNSSCKYYEIHVLNSLKLLHDLKTRLSKEKLRQFNLAIKSKHIYIYQISVKGFLFFCPIVYMHMFFKSK